MSAQRILTSTLALVLLFALTVGLSAQMSPNAKAQGPGSRVSQSPQAALNTTASATLGTSFTYQGRLTDDGDPVTDTCDLRFRLYDAASSGTQVGSTQTANSVALRDGRFTVQLSFGSSAFTGNARWLEVAVRCPAGSGSYTTLTPRQALTPAPYALALPGLWTQQNATSPNVIGGYSGNRVADGFVGATIGGGGSNDHINEVTADYATVGGGLGNRANGTYASVGAGWVNIASGDRSTIGGGTFNTASGYKTTVGGGGVNVATGDYATVGGGGDNTASGTAATVGGGGFNIASGESSTIGGGEQISVTGQAATVAGGSHITATGNYAAVSGGRYNTASESIATVGGGYNNEASGYAATVGGGSCNTASGWYATVGGGSDNTAQGQYSFAAGRRAKANHKGAFVWADSTDADFASTANDQFAVSANGGAWFTGLSDSAPLLQATQSGSNDALYVAQYGDGRAGFLGINNTGNSNPALQVTTNGSGDYILAGSSSEPDFRVLNTGEVRSDIGFNTPANDFAEMTAVEGDPAGYEPGDVLVVSSARDRAVGLSSTPYARAVIGVYSTAPGFVGGRSVSDDDQVNSVPVAILGIVPCKVSTENGPIYRGDLLVTSSTPGHAMRATAPPAGTVLGKALEPLDTGTGVILILVTLQ